MKNLTIALKDVVDWETLGLYLDVEMSTIETIARDRNHRDPHLCKMDLLNHWLRNDPDPSWEKVAAALDEMERQGVAEKIRRTYCS